MSRQKKVGNVAVAEPIAEPVAPVAPVATDVFKVKVVFKVRTKDGDRISYRFVSEATTPLEALNLIGEEPEELAGQPLPKGLNLLTTVTLKVGDYTYSRNLAPHVFRNIFEDKNYKLFLKLFMSKELFDKYVPA